MPARSDANQWAAAETIQDAARANEHDRYLSALLAPRACRDDLLAVAAFLGEVARIPRAVSDPRIAEIRLQWWIDAIEGFATDAAPTGSPVADALRAVAARRGLAAADLAAAVEARFADCAGAPVADEAALDHHLAGAEGSGFRLAARILDVPPSEERDAALDAAGVAYGLVRELAALPDAVAAGRMRLPVTWPEAAALAATAQSSPARDQAMRALIARGAAHARAKLRRLHDFSAHAPAQSAHSFNAAVLPCALVEPYLQALERGGSAAARSQPGHTPLLTPLTRVWRLWRAHRRGRF